MDYIKRFGSFNILEKGFKQFFNFILIIALALTTIGFSTRSVDASLLNINVFNDFGIENNSGSSPSNRLSSNAVHDVTFTVDAKEGIDVNGVVDASLRKILVKAPNDILFGSGSNDAQVAVEGTFLSSEVPLLVEVNDFVNNLTNVLQTLTVKVGVATVTIGVDLSSVNDVLIEIENILNTNFVTNVSISDDGKYAILDIDEGLVQTLTVNLRTLLTQLNNVVKGLKVNIDYGGALEFLLKPLLKSITSLADGLTNTLSDLVIVLDGILSPVLDTTDGLMPTVNQILNASVLGKLNATIPTSVNVPHFDNDEDIVFQSMIVHTDLIDLTLLGNAVTSNTTVFIGGGEQIQGVMLEPITGSTKVGHGMTGTAEPGSTLVITKEDSTVLTTITVGADGKFSYISATGNTNANEPITFESTKDGQTKVAIGTTPADPVVNIQITGHSGNTQIGIVLKGKTNPGTLVHVSGFGDLSENVGPNMSADGSFTYTINNGLVGEIITFDAELLGFTDAVDFIIPADPTVNLDLNEFDGNSKEGYLIGGKTVSNATISVSDEDGNPINYGTISYLNQTDFLFTIDAQDAIEETNYVFVATKDGIRSPEVTRMTPVDPPILLELGELEGNSQHGYVIEGKTSPNAAVTVTHDDLGLIDVVTADDNGDLTINILPLNAKAGTLYYFNAELEGDESGEVVRFSPQDPIVVLILDNITGDSVNDHVIKGTATVGSMVSYENEFGDSGTLTVDSFGEIDERTKLQHDTDYTFKITKDGFSGENVVKRTPVDPVVNITVGQFEGNSSKGFSITGNIGAGSTLEISDDSGTLTLDNLVIDAIGDFTYEIPTADAEQNKEYRFKALNNGFESGVEVRSTPTDPLIDAPTIQDITGSSVDGWDVIGTGKPGQSIFVKDMDYNVIGTASVDSNGDYSVFIDKADANPKDLIYVVAVEDSLESVPTMGVIPDDVDDGSDQDVTPPTVDEIKGSSKDGWDVTGTGKPGQEIIIKDKDGNDIGNGIVDNNGDYTVTIDKDSAQPKDVIDVIAVENGVESTPVEATIPDDVDDGSNTGVLPPTITSIRGNSKDGWTIEGKAKPGQTIHIYNPNEIVIATTFADLNGSYYAVIIPVSANPEDVISAVAVQNGIYSQPTYGTLPKDEDDGSSKVVNPPTVDEITGSSKDGWDVTGTGKPGQEIIIKDKDGNEIGKGTVDTDGNFTVTIGKDSVQPKDTIYVVAVEDGVESTPVEAIIPDDSGNGTDDEDVVTPPIVDNIDGSVDEGYEVEGSGKPGTDIIITDKDRNEIGNGKVDKDGNFVVIIKPGVVKPGDTTYVYAEDNGKRSKPTTAVIPKSDSSNLPATGVNNNLFTQLVLIGIGAILVLGAKKKENEGIS